MRGKRLRKEYLILKIVSIAYRHFNFDKLSTGLEGNSYKQKIYIGLQNSALPSR